MGLHLKRPFYFIVLYLISLEILKNSNSQIFTNESKVIQKKIVRSPRQPGRLLQKRDRNPQCIAMLDMPFYNFCLKIIQKYFRPKPEALPRPI
jgi:hypothetical protein